jgi:hypothetical protein
MTRWLLLFLSVSLMLPGWLCVLWAVLNTREFIERR